MRIEFCGADRTVTGSCHRLEINGLKILLDMGMFQGARDLANTFNRSLPEGARDVDAVILSHGHLDHCGKLPVLTRAGFNKPIYCTPATAEVARVVLEDAAQIQEEDCNYLNRRSKGPDDTCVEPLYVRSDIPNVLRLLRRTPYAQRTELGKGVFFTFYDAGHILGSAYVIVEWTEGTRQRSLLFTADIGRYNTPILRDPVPLAGPVDYVITESTYGGKKHASMQDVGPQLLEAARYVVNRRSRLLVPSFAVGRTQTILWYMQRFISEGKLPQIPVYVDSPMGVEVSEIHSQFRDNYDDETKAAIGTKDLFGTARVTFSRTSDESRRINGDTGPCVIIASSPTCEFGRILHHLKMSVERPNDLVVFVGWTPPNTLGRRLQDGQKRVRIYDRWYDAKCQVQTIHGLSAHADGSELIQFLTPTIRPETRFHVVHGEPAQAEAMAGALAASGAVSASVPALGSTVLGVVPQTGQAQSPEGSSMRADAE